MPKTLSQLIYVSATRSEPARQTLLDILKTSREQNAQHDVTGMLLYDRRSFLQVIEGPQAALTTLFGNIQRDIRHFNVQHILTQPVTTRDFADWTMAFSDLTSDDLAKETALSDFFKSRGTRLQNVDHSLALTMVDGFRNGLFHVAATGHFRGLPLTTD